jgi:glycopeptide antibiotics resistance protein
MEWGRLAAVVLFTIYLVGVANFVILPLQVEPDLVRDVGAPEIWRLINLEPVFMPGADQLSSEQLYLNVLLTVPFGFGLPFVASLSLLSVVGIGVLFSLGIEAAQLLADATQLALPPWSIDINDVITNSLGVVIGVVLFVIAGAIYRSLAAGLDSSRLGIWAHFHRTLVDGRSPRSLPAHQAPDGGPSR